ncbi:MAG TPA: glycosyltransferase family 39 protein [Streptosporangiaceae bacterium]
MKARIAQAWPLWSILTAQLVLTVPWLWRTGPYSDEALYIDAGHHEWAHWLHGAALPSYPSSFSGAPVIFPPITAAADSAGGLVAARLPSLAFALLTTALIYLVGKRLFGRAAAIFGSLIFAISGLVVHYGALATFDPMAMCLLMTAAWAAVRARDGGFGWLPACAFALIAANLTKYGTTAWDVVVVGMLALCGWNAGRTRAIGMAASVAGTVAVADAGLVLFGGRDYLRGILVTTVARSIQSGPPAPASTVLLHALAMTGLIVVPAAAGVVLSLLRRMPWPATALLGLLALAALITPLEQARIHQLSSLDRNCGYGLIFAALGAGYALSAGRVWVAERWAWGRIAGTVAAIAAVLAVLVMGRLEPVQFRGPGIATVQDIVGTIHRNYRPDTFIVSDGAARMEQYYLSSIPAGSWIAIFHPGSRQAAAIESRICAGTVSVVVLRTRAGVYDHAYDATVAHLIHRSGEYKLATVAGGGEEATRVWILRDPSHRIGGCVR